MDKAIPAAPGARDMLCIVLSFNGYADTAACLDSLAAVEVPGFDVLVVDNASKDGVTAQLAASYPDVELLALPDNRGWAGGNNVGIRIGLERGYRWICLLNNDTVFPAGQVQAWLDAARAAPPCLLHPSIWYWDEPEVAQLCPGQASTDTEHRYVDDGSGLTRMNFAYGACLAVPREIFERIGLFDERFFLQLEEADFHMRAVSAGYHAMCNSSVRIFHKESRAFGGTQAAIKTYYSTRNTLLLIEKNHRGFRSRFKGWKRLYWTVSNLARTTERLPRMGKSGFARWLLSRAPSARAVRAGARDYVLRRFGKVSDNFREQLVLAEKSHAKQFETHPG